MTTGLFRTSNSQGIGARAHQRCRATAALDRFAESLAETGDVKATAAALGMSYEYGNALLQRIRKKLGGQAI